MREIQKIAEIPKVNSVIYSDKVAVFEPGIIGKDGKSVCYSELERQVTEAKRILIACGINKGDHVGLISRNCIEYVVYYFAVLGLNALCVPLSPAECKLDLMEISMSCSLKYYVLINITDNYHGLNTVNEHLNIKICTNKNYQGVQKALPDDSVLLMKTSGSTAKAKVCVHTNKSLLFSARSHLKAVGYTENEIGLVVLPMVYSFVHTSQFISIFLVGGTLIIYPQDKFVNILSIKKYVKMYSITSICLQASQLSLWSQFEQDDKVDSKLQTLKTVCFAGGPASYNAYSYLRSKYTNISFLQAYGLTEAGPRVSINDRNVSADDKSCGRPVKGVEVIICDDHRQSLPVNHSGEVCVKGPNLMLYYYNLSEEENKAFFHEEYFLTGDIGTMDHRGVITIIGRKKNIIIKQGMKISPEEIEAQINKHPSVLESYVYGQEDNIYGEIIVAEIVLKEDIKTAHIFSFLKGILAAYKIPDIINKVSSFEKTENGKIKRLK